MPDRHWIELKIDMIKKLKKLIDTEYWLWPMCSFHLYTWVSLSPWTLSVPLWLGPAHPYESCAILASRLRVGNVGPLIAFTKATKERERPLLKPNEGHAFLVVLLRPCDLGIHLRNLFTKCLLHQSAKCLLHGMGGGRSALSGCLGQIATTKWLFQDDSKFQFHQNIMPLSTNATNRVCQPWCYYCMSKQKQWITAVPHFLPSSPQLHLRACRQAVGHRLVIRNTWEAGKLDETWLQIPSKTMSL